MRRKPVGEMDNTLVLKGDDDYDELYGCDDLRF